MGPHLKTHCENPFMPSDLRRYLDCKWILAKYLYYKIFMCRQIGWKCRCQGDKWAVFTWTDESLPVLCLADAAGGWTSVEFQNEKIRLTRTLSGFLISVGPSTGFCFPTNTKSKLELSPGCYMPCPAYNRWIGRNSLIFNGLYVKWYLTSKFKSVFCAKGEKIL